MLELSSLQGAIASLQESLYWHSKGCDEVPNDIIRDSVIQRFEYTYELAWKLIKRWLEINLGSSYVDGISRRELFRLAAENHLIDNPDKWFAFHTARNQTSHIYDRLVAGDVFNEAVAFADAAADLYKQLEKRND